MSSHVARRGRPPAERSEDQNERQASLLERVGRPGVAAVELSTPSCHPVNSAPQAARLERAAAAGAPKARGGARRPSSLQQQALCLEKEAQERRCELRALVAASPLLSGLLKGPAALALATSIGPGRPAAAYVDELRSQIHEHALAAGIRLTRDGSLSQGSTPPSESSSSASPRRGSSASCSSAGSCSRVGRAPPPAGSPGAAQIASLLLRTAAAVERAEAEVRNLEQARAVRAWRARRASAAAEAEAQQQAVAAEAAKASEAAALRAQELRARAAEAVRQHRRSQLLAQAEEEKRAAHASARAAHTVSAGSQIIICHSHLLSESDKPPDSHSSLPHEFQAFQARVANARRVAFRRSRHAAWAAARQREELRQRRRAERREAALVALAASVAPSVEADPRRVLAPTAASLGGAGEDAWPGQVRQQVPGFSTEALLRDRRFLLFEALTAAGLHGSKHAHRALVAAPAQSALPWHGAATALNDFAAGRARTSG